MSSRARRMAKSVLPDVVKQTLRKSAWASLDLCYQLQSGLKVRVRGNSDWYIYNEIFVDRDYDPAILCALRQCDSSNGKVRILDLGANVGYFALRCFDLAFQNGFASESLEVVAVEANRNTAQVLSERIKENSLDDLVSVQNGLVGQRTGAGQITDREFCGNNTVKAIATDSTQTVNFVDLATMFASEDRIDLLKCDIEGSELEFLRNYADLLRTVSTAVIELHPELCDVKECKRLLLQYGLRQTSVLMQKDAVSLLQFNRA